MLSYSNVTCEDELKLRIEEANGIKWYVDTAFAVLNKMESQTAAIMP